MIKKRVEVTTLFDLADKRAKQLLRKHKVRKRPKTAVKGRKPYLNEIVGGRLWQLRKFTKRR